MQVNLTPQSEAIIERLLATGRYKDANEVVIEALSYMAECEDEDDQRLREAIAIGITQMERGEVIDITPDYWEDLRRRVNEAARLGLPIKDDVKP